MNLKEYATLYLDYRNKNDLTQEAMRIELEENNIELSLKTYQRMEKGDDAVKKTKYIQVLEYIGVEYKGDGSKVVYENNDFYRLKKMDGISNAAVFRDSGLSLESLKLIKRTLDHLYQVSYGSVEDCENYNVRLETYSVDLNVEIEARILENEFKENNLTLFYTERFTYEISENISKSTPFTLNKIKIPELFFKRLDSKDIKKTSKGKSYIMVENFDYNEIEKERKELTERLSLSSLEELLAMFPELKIETDPEITSNFSKKEIEKKKQSITYDVLRKEFIDYRYNFEHNYAVNNNLYHTSGFYEEMEDNKKNYIAEFEEWYVNGGDTYDVEY